jgi:hypothetical protein
VSHLRLCCEQLCDEAVSCLASGFQLLRVCHLITCPLLTPQIFLSLQSLPVLNTLRLESCSCIKSHPLSPHIMLQTLPLMTSLQCLELSDSISPSNAEAFGVLSRIVCKAPRPLRIHCHPKSCIDEPIFQSDFHREISPLGSASFFCAGCSQLQLRSERYITWFAESCCFSIRGTGCEFLVFAAPQHRDYPLSARAVALHTCLACRSRAGLGASSIQLDDEYFQFGTFPSAAIPVRAEDNHELEPNLTGFCCMRRSDGLPLPKTKSRQRQLWYACM